jgi:hypothetical protein
MGTYQNRIICLLVIAAIYVFCFSTGCVKTTVHAPELNEAGEINAIEAVLLAFEELEKRDVNVNEEFELKLMKKEGGWMCYIQLIPKTPGRFVLVSVQGNGDVTIMPGF